MYSGNQVKQATTEQRLKRVEEIAEHTFNFIGSILTRQAQNTQERLKKLRTEIIEHRAEKKRHRNKKSKPIRRNTIKKRY